MSDYINPTSGTYDFSESLIQSRYEDGTIHLESVGGCLVCYIGNDYFCFAGSEDLKLSPEEYEEKYPTVDIVWEIKDVLDNWKHYGISNERLDRMAAVILPHESYISSDVRKHLELIATSCSYTLNERGGIDGRGNDTEDNPEINIYALQSMLEAAYLYGKQEAHETAQEDANAPGLIEDVGRAVRAEIADSMQAIIDALNGI